MVRAVVGGISLRAQPGLAAERLGSLAPDSRSVVLTGPQGADGYEWFELSGPGLPPASGCTTPLPTEPLTCPIWHGWAAVGDPSTGEAWLVSDPTDCPDPAADMAAFATLGDYEAIHCYGSSQITFPAWLVHDPAALGQCAANDVPSRWLWCHDGWTAYPGPNEITNVGLFFDPNAGVSPAADQRMAQITGHHDDPAAAGCAEAAVAESGIPPATAARDCRGRFVVTAIADAPAP